MKNKKRWLSLGLAALLCAGLAGCGQPAQSQSASSEPASGGSDSSQSQPQKESPIYQVGDHWFDRPDELDMNSVDRFGKKVQELQEKYLSADNRLYCAIIPDKSEFVAGQGQPVLESAPILEGLEGQLGNAQLIDLTGTLTLDNYYKADGHWRQEDLQPVLDVLGQAMDFTVDLSQWTAHSHAGFVGAYTEDIPEGQAPEDELVWLTSPATDSATVKHFQDDCTAVYDPERLQTAIPYDVYLSGATPLVTITCPEAQTDRELVIFRDSFGSSIAPLLCGQYRTITLVDLRYMVSAMLPQYVEFTDQDVLFLYSAAVVNRSAMLR